jgi:type II secretory pathway component PulF
MNFLTPQLAMLAPDGWHDAAGWLQAITLYLLLGLAPFCVGVYAICHLLTMPLRRNGRARLFLDLLQLGLEEGHMPEHIVTDASAHPEPELEEPLRRLTADLQRGCRFVDALSRHPLFLPPRVTAMLRAGERIGDLRRMLPACRQVLSDGLSQVRGALNYVLILTLVIAPLALVLPLMINMLILPKFKEVFAGLYPGLTLPALTQLVFESSRPMLWIQSIVLVGTWVLMLAYVGGPWLSRLLGRMAPGLPDRVQWAFAWRRKRLQRDFSAVLAILLDSAVPEPEALALAAEATGSLVMRRRAASAVRALKGGEPLPKAVRAMDRSGELEWRLTNALSRRGGFMEALAGWHAALDARAFQLEQAAAQVTTTGLLLFNGVVVAAVVIALFLPLIEIVHVMALW